MQVWLVVGAWAFAVLFAIVLLGFAGYELAWKTRRLAADRAKLDEYLTSVREVEKRAQAMRSEKATADERARDRGRPLERMPRPDNGLPEDIRAQVKPLWSLNPQSEEQMRGRLFVPE